MSLTVTYRKKSQNWTKGSKWQMRFVSKNFPCLISKEKKSWKPSPRSALMAKRQGWNHSLMKYASNISSQGDRRLWSRAEQHSKARLLIPPSTQTLSVSGETLGMLTLPPTNTHSRGPSYVGVFIFQLFCLTKSCNRQTNEHITRSPRPENILLGSLESCMSILTKSHKTAKDHMAQQILLSTTDKLFPSHHPLLPILKI